MVRLNKSLQTLFINKCEVGRYVLCELLAVDVRTLVFFFTHIDKSLKL